MIQFAYPAALLSLLAIPLLVALHFLQPRRRRVVLSTTMLWQAALKDRERRLGFRRLLRNLSLLLLLASALALGLALGGPQWLTRTSEGADTVVVIDVSASMKTRSGNGQTRFDLALEQATGIVDGLPRDGRMLLMTSGRKAVLRTGFETSRDTLRTALAAVRPGDEVGRPREALALALSLIRGRDQARIYFLTDGAFDPETDPASPQVVFRIVGEPARNVAITRFDFRQELAGGERFQVLMTVRNYGEAPVVAPASVTLNERVLFRRSLEIEPGAEQTLVLPFTGVARGEAIGRIEIDDDLAADNQAYAAVNTDDPLRVLLFTQGNFYLESVLEALPDLNLVKRNGPPGEDLARLALSHDIIVFDGVEVPRLPPGNFLLVNTVPPGLPFADAGRLVRPEKLVRGESALMRDVDMTAVRIDQARSITIDKPVPGLQRLMWSSETDLALALLDGGVRLVYLGFDVTRSNFPLQAAFPLFFSHSLEWLRPHGGTGFVSTHVAAGSTRRIVLPAGETRIAIRTPAGGAETLEVRDGVLLFDATADAGIYRYSTGVVSRFFAVTLADARESDVNRRWAPARQQDAQASATGAQALVPLWPYLLVLALVLLALEWVVWTRNRSYA